MKTITPKSLQKAVAWWQEYSAPRYQDINIDVFCNEINAEAYKLEVNGEVVIEMKKFQSESGTPHLLYLLPTDFEDVTC